MKKLLLLTAILSLALTACGKKEEESFYDKVVAGVVANEASGSSAPKIDNSNYLFGYLQIDDFEIDRSGHSDKAKAKITNSYNGTFEGHIALVTYDEDMNILDTQYVSLPKTGLKKNESFIVDEYIRKEDYHTLRFADADMLRLK